MQKQLQIKTNATKRLFKEYVHYLKEETTEKDRLKTMELENPNYTQQVKLNF